LGGNKVKIKVYMRRRQGRKQNEKDKRCKNETVGVALCVER
jgi:hypothetical protein